MIDICAFFEYTTDVSRGKMVTIYRKKLLASCLFLLRYSTFLLLAVSGSYDYTASGALVNELEPLKPEKHRSEWLSNHEWDYPSLKGNYHSRKSRSTLEKETSRAEETWTEDASRGAEGKWVPRRKRKFERFAGLESIGNASGFVQEEKEKEDTDAIKTTTMTVELIEKDNNLENETRKEDSGDAKGEKEDHPKDEASVEEGKGKNATEILEFRSKVPRFPTELGQEGLDGEPEDGGYPTQRWMTSVKILPKEFPKEILRRKDHRHRKGGKKGGMPDIEFKNSKVYEEDLERNEESEEQDEKDEDVKKEKTDLEEKEEGDHDESEENGGPATNASTSTIELFKIISDVFLPMMNNTNIGPYPWRVLTSSRYTKEVTKQEGPHLKTTTKETKSNVNLFFANDLGQTIKRKDDTPKIDNSEIVEKDQLLETVPREMIKVITNVPMEMNTNIPIEVTTNAPIEVTTNAPIDTTTTELAITTRKEDCELPKENVEKSVNENDASLDTFYRILDTPVLIVTRFLDLRDQPILDWY